MYKCEYEDIERRLSMAKKWKPNKLAVVGLALMVFLAGYGGVAGYPILIICIFFTVFYLRYQFIDPLLGKIELLEEELSQIREQLGVDKQKLL